MRVGSSSMPNAPPVVAMGAYGSGKSTIGGVLADALGVAIFDGDSRHRPRPAVRGQNPSLTPHGLSHQVGSPDARGSYIGAGCRWYRFCVDGHDDRAVDMNLGLRARADRQVRN